MSAQIFSVSAATLTAQHKLCSVVHDSWQFSCTSIQNWIKCRSSQMHLHVHPSQRRILRWLLWHASHGTHLTQCEVKSTRQCHILLATHATCHHSSPCRDVIADVSQQCWHHCHRWALLKQSFAMISDRVNSALGLITCQTTNPGWSWSSGKRGVMMITTNLIRLCALWFIERVSFCGATLVRSSQCHCIICDHELFIDSRSWWNVHASNSRSPIWPTDSGAGVTHPCHFYRASLAFHYAGCRPVPLHPFHAFP